MSPIVQTEFIDGKFIVQLDLTLIYWAGIGIASFFGLLLVLLVVNVGLGSAAVHKLNSMAREDSSSRRKSLRRKGDFYNDTENIYHSD